ncbi:MAG: DUF3662 domain-containing protein [Eggerthellaceae bacterium]|nr:DUF3662 domain-containing protein [Eggerthellaceae bacterium]
MGFLSKFEGKMEDTVEGAAERMGGSTLSPVQIAKKAEKQMRREKVVGAGNQYAPTLYTVLVSAEDDARMMGYYPTLAGETETFLRAKASELGLVMDGQPLVRFIADPELKRGKFDVVAEMVAAPIIMKLRNEEMARYGLANNSPRSGAVALAGAGAASLAGAGAPPSSARPQRRHASKSAAHPARPSHAAAANAVVNTSYTFEDFNEPDSPLVAPETVAAKASEFSSNNTETEISPLDAYLYDEARDIAYVLTGQLQTIGRESENEIVVPDINVSRQHAEIFLNDDGSWIINDLDSTNGLFLNGRKISASPLRDADMIRLGTTELEFQLLS